jgi:prepilin-type N-terminal cleavage/methylation domain-containing protein
MRRRAFTLFELLVALAVVVMLVASLAAALSIAFKSKRSSEESVNSVKDVYSVMDSLIVELQNAAPPNPKSNQDQLAAELNQAANTATDGTTITSTTSLPLYLYGPFLGDSQSIKFYATGPEPNATIQSDARLVYICLEDQPDGTRALVRHVETNLLSTDTDPAEFPTEQSGEIIPEILVSNVQDVKFSYYDGSALQDSWDSTQLAPYTQLANTLPNAVKVELILNPLHEGGQPRLITRFATLWCADASIMAAGTTAATSEAAAIPSVGIGN